MRFFKAILFAVLFITIAFGVKAQPFSNPLAGKKEPWSKRQLIEPSDLVKLMNSKHPAKPMIFNIGVVEDIKGARNMGAASHKENLEKFAREIADLSKTAPIVVYCGCCPFDRCPNIRPAFTLLTQKGFSNARLLNIPTNIKVDWIDKGYPLKGKNGS